MNTTVSEQLEAFPESRPVARSTDPGTSWAAARSITVDQLRRNQYLVLMVLEQHGPMTDTEILDRLNAMERTTPSGARTRRKELVGLGLVRDSGREAVLPTGRRSKVWEAVPEEQERG